MKDIKRTCSLCERDITPLKIGGLSQINSRRGHGLGLFCADCYLFVLKAVDASPRCYRHAGWSDTIAGNAAANQWIMDRARQLRSIATTTPH